VDYYSTRDYAWTYDRASSLRKHTDHCIDILRQVLMCNGDMGLVMFHWVSGIGPAPYPDFSTMVSLNILIAYDLVVSDD